MRDYDFRPLSMFPDDPSGPKAGHLVALKLKNGRQLRARFKGTDFAVTDNENSKTGAVVRRVEVDLWSEAE